MRAFRSRVAATIARCHMLAPGDTVMVALSAGADSTALLHALVQLKDKLRCRVCACHVHHGIRGADADADADHAGRFAESLGVIFSVVHADVPAYAKKGKLSLEAAAREVRYQLLDQAAQAMGADRIATGHTADDQAETVLLNLLRGAGPSGLAGIPPVRGKVTRPLLEVTRVQVEAYCQAQGLAYRTDPSNLDLRFTRNRIRHRILPALREIQPRAEAALCRLAHIMREEDTFMAELASQSLEQITSAEADRPVLPPGPFAQLPPALQRRVARAFIARVKGDELDLPLERVEALVKLLLSGGAGARIELPGGLEATRTYDAVVISQVGKLLIPPTQVWELPLPGRLAIPELGTDFSVYRSHAKRPFADPFIALVDERRVSAPLRVRTWRAGDRFVPYGMQESVKLQDFFVNLKVPRGDRKWTPLVLCGERIMWVVGYRISDEFKVTPETRRTIRIEARTDPGIRGDGRAR